MNEDKLLAILDLCLALERRASEIYANLSSFSKNDKLKSFWKEMSEEEDLHVTFWKELQDLAKERKLPQVFDDPDSVKSELERAFQRVEALLYRWEMSRDVADAFILAYRMEFYMLHPAFAILFHSMGTLSSGINPKDSYENHINNFIETFANAKSTEIV